MRLIDVLHLGRRRVIGCWVVDDVLVDPGPASCLDELLRSLEGARPRALLLTHIHLDHAGATGTLVERWPDLEVYVHERGVPHLIDPSRLLESARRLYGENMDTLWGEMVPVPEKNLRALAGGETILNGRFEVLYAPGHASHHVCYRHGATAFVGDVGGVRISARSPTIPPTPPPDIDLEAWHDSIDRVRSWRPEQLAITHFGAYAGADQQLSALDARLDDWAGRAREQDQEMFMAGIEAEIDDAAEAGLLSAYVQAAPPEQLYAGLERYWRKQAEAVTAATPPPVS